MNKAAVALGLAGFAAAGAISTLAQAPSAPAGQTSLAKLNCSPGNHPGQAVQETEYLKVNGRRPPSGRSYIKNGNEVKTTSRGTAIVCLRAGGTTCELDAGTRLVVLPSPRALATLKAGGITCVTGAGKQIERDFETKAQTIDLGPGDTGTERHLAGTPAPNEGHLFSLRVQGARATVKVQRGATVVGRRADRSQAVVVGREQQVVAAADPTQPTNLTLTAQEQRTFAHLQQLLPPLKDKEAPTADIKGSPPNQSSTRRARFTFSSSEPAAIFSCSIDGGPFHVCDTSQRFDNLAPGTHQLSVTATDTTGNVGKPHSFGWFIDSSKIVFVSERDGNREIYSMDTDGRNQKRLTNNPATDSAPALSPDGKQIAFDSDRTGNYELYLMNTDGTGIRQLTKNSAFDLNPTWSPDGNQLAFESARDGNSELYAMNLDGTNVRRLTNDPAPDFDPAWSPDGTRIAFASRRLGGNNDIFVMNADGSNQKVLAADPAIDFNPAWSPDSKHIFFHSDRDRESSQIYVMDADGSNVKRITTTRASDFNPVVAPDGVTIAFQSNLHGNDDIYIVDTSGNDLTQLTENSAADLAPDW